MTTPDKEVNPTTDRAAGPWTTDGRYIRASERGIVSDVIAIVDGRARMTNEANAQFIVTACNAYEPMREALDELANAARTYVNVTEREVIPEGDLLSTTAWHGLIECLHNAEKAHTALSTLPVNDRHHSGSDNERNFENVRDAWKIIWEREAEIARLSRSLSELEAHHVEQNRLKRRSEADSKTLRIIRAALYGTDRQTSDDVGRLRALLEEELVWHEERDKSLSKQPQSNQTVWRRAEHQERIDVIRAALKGPASEAGR